MRQVLDLIEALDRSDAQSEGSAQIVWRLTEAHTNSPPFTVTAEAFPVDPAVSVTLAAQRIVLFLEPKQSAGAIVANMIVK